MHIKKVYIMPAPVGTTLACRGAGSERFWAKFASKVRARLENRGRREGFARGLRPAFHGEGGRVGDGFEALSVALRASQGIWGFGPGPAKKISKKTKNSFFEPLFRPHF